MLIARVKAHLVTGETVELLPVRHETDVKKEVTAAGFEFVGDSDVLANKSDTRTGKVFDPAIRGKTDQFILKFRKPKKK